MTLENKQKGSGFNLECGVRLEAAEVTNPFRPLNLSFPLKRKLISAELWFKP
jgi:hypothetical protein